MHNISRNTLLFGAVFILLLGLLYLNNQRQQGTPAALDKTPSTVNSNWYPVDSFSHAHGLALDAVDPNKLYIATHEGLFVLSDERDFYQIGRNVDDYMGFTAHPATAGVFWTSGHPVRGGNLGVQRSDDAGVTWTKLSDGAGGPVDFHAMTVSVANPDILYGWFRGLQKSSDGGKTWRIVDTDLGGVIRLATDPTDAQVVYAATSQGLFVSGDQGVTWKAVSSEFEGAAVTAFAVHPRDGKQLMTFSERLGLVRSADGGVSWMTVGENFGGDGPLFIVFDGQTVERVYVLTKNHRVYKSSDSGVTWGVIR